MIGILFIFRCFLSHQGYLVRISLNTRDLLEQKMGTVICITVECRQEMNFRVFPFENNSVSHRWLQQLRLCLAKWQMVLFPL